MFVEYFEQNGLIVNELEHCVDGCCFWRVYMYIVRGECMWWSIGAWTTRCFGRKRGYRRSCYHTEGITAYRLCNLS